MEKHTKHQIDFSTAEIEHLYRRIKKLEDTAITYRTLIAIAVGIIIAKILLALL